MERTIASIELSAFSHATEDPKKVLKAIKNLLPENRLNDIEFQEEDVEGHHGNPIKIFRATITKKDIVNETVRLFAQRLNSLDKSFLRREIEKQGKEDRDLYIRLDKQAAYLGKVKLLTEDPIKVRFKFRLHPKGYSEFIKVYQELGLIA